MQIIVEKDNILKINYSTDTDINFSMNQDDAEIFIVNAD